MVITAWILGGLFSLADALVYAELAAMMPRTGGEYVFIREAYGRLWGFLYGWMRFFVAGTGAQAALAIGFAIFINVVTRGAIGTNYFSLDLLGYRIAFGGVQAVAITAIFVVTLVNCATVAIGAGRTSRCRALQACAKVSGQGRGAASPGSERR
jgi:APA family basic amino acid/polyamine antiporter